MRLFLLLSFNAFMLLEAYGFSDETDRQALLEFKSQVSEGKSDVLPSWNNSFPLCKWNGVTCGRKHKRVTRLDLGGLKLTGMISPSIGNISFLISLNFSSNSFGGIIPQEVGKLFRLKYLDMSLNVLQGEIPSTLSNCSRLLELYLHSNLLGGGGVPLEIGSLRNLVVLDVSRNNLMGELPTSLGNMTSLQEVSFEFNNIKGGVPNDIARLSQMVAFTISVNNFSGVFPSVLYNMSSLEFLGVLDNRFSGTLRTDFGDLLPNLQGVSMGRNHFIGGIPPTVSNITNLQKFGISRNNLTGSIPPSFGKLKSLQYLSLLGNDLGSNSFEDLEFLTALTNCTQLETLYFGENRLGGHLPTSIVNMSTRLHSLSLGSNFIFGSIPEEVGNLVSLQSLDFGKNRLTGILPNSLGKLLKLEGLSLTSNNFRGEIPSSIGNITRLAFLDVSNNAFKGVIPSSLSKCANLQNLLIGFNKLNGTIPREIMQIPSLVNLNLEGNLLTGSLLEDVGRLQNLVTLSTAHNKLSGQLPQALGKCLSMEKLYLHGNNFDGVIPDISGLVGVKEVDLSSNSLSGSIPKYLANFSKLQYLNLSINNLEGKVPTEGKFQNVSIVSVFGNKNLCGGVKELKLKPCIVQAPAREIKGLTLTKKVAIGVSVGVALLLLVIVVLFSQCWFKKRKKNKQTNSLTPSTLDVFHEKISYKDLQNATNGFSSSNLIGSGSFGTVFKALLPEKNKLVAVKVLNLQRHGAMKSFMAECESLKDIRHRNIVKLLTACSSIDFQGNEFRALIYEFMPNGNLDMWLHPEEVEETRRPSRTLTLLERLNIAIDVASVLNYLHVHCHDPIAHCDLKPSNVLLDDHLIAHVSDFGLARLLLKLDQESFLNQLSSAGIRGTIGYAAPEYGMGGPPSIHGDVYSFGVLILEMFTGKRPTDELFEGDFTLQSYTKSAMPERVLEIADQSILHTGLRVGFPIVQCLTRILDVGLKCCEVSPTNRMITNEAIKELISIREKFGKAKRTTRG